VLWKKHDDFLMLLIWYRKYFFVNIFLIFIIFIFINSWPINWEILKEEDFTTLRKNNLIEVILSLHRQNCSELVSSTIVETKKDWSKVEEFQLITIITIKSTTKEYITIDIGCNHSFQIISQSTFQFPLYVRRIQKVRRWQTFGWKLL